jgi:hypothetical protein
MRPLSTASKGSEGCYLQTIDFDKTKLCRPAIDFGSRSPSPTYGRIGDTSVQPGFLPEKTMVYYIFSSILY